MWSLFSRDPTTSFPYEIGDVVQPVDERSIFRLHYAKKKACGTPVSAFVCHGAVHDNAELELARSAVRRLKSLKHPCILDYLDSLESDKAVYLVTGRVAALQSWLLDCGLASKHKHTVTAWGLRRVLTGLVFLIEDAQLQHQNICSSSVFVTPGGEWKIAGVEYCRAAPPKGVSPELPPKRLPPSLNVYDAPEKENPRLHSLMTAWSTDAWGFGCLMWEVFTLTPLMQTAALQNTSKLPAEIQSLFRHIIQDVPNKRLHPRQLLDKVSEQEHYLNNDLIQTMDFLDNIHIKQDSDKLKFFAELTHRLDNIPDFIAKNAILPATITAHQFSNVGSVVLASLFKMSKLLSDEEYQDQVLPSVVKLFSSSDRATRLHLLQQMEQLVTHMDPVTVNDKVFTEIATGFMDTNPTIREHTVKSVLHLAPKLNHHNLNVEVLRHFARLQAKDEQGGIRTNCTVCLGKVAANLAPVTRQKCLISAFTRALKDPFPPARIAGVMALAATQHYYPLDQVACRILPALCPLMMDSEKNVRDAVFRVIRGFMGKLEKLSEDPTLKGEMERDITTASPLSDAASGWAGWAVGTLASKFYKSSISVQAGDQKTDSTITAPPTSSQAGASSGGGGGKKTNTSSSTSATSSSTKTKPSTTAPSATGHPNGRGKTSVPPEGVDDPSESVSATKQSCPTTADAFLVPEVEEVEEGDGWGDGSDEDDDWKAIEDSPTAEEGWEDAAADGLGGQLEQLVLDCQGTSRGAGSRQQSPPPGTGGADGRGLSKAPEVTKSAAGYNWSASSANPDSDDFFASLATDKGGGGGRGGVAVDDWGVAWDPSAASEQSGALSSSDPREQKRLERQRQIEARRAAKGPMKLGVKKP